MLKGFRGGEDGARGGYVHKLGGRCEMGLLLDLEMAGRYVVKEMESRAEMDAIMDVIWAANYDPYDTYAQLFFPVLGYTSSAREAAITESKARFWENHSSAATSNWFYVEDTASGKVVGCAQWEIHTQNPFKAGTPTLQAPWWPEGEYRDFCEEIIRQVYTPRTSWMRRPHLGEYCLYAARFILTRCSAQLDGSRANTPGKGHRVPLDEHRDVACGRARCRMLDGGFLDGEETVREAWFSLAFQDAVRHGEEERERCVEKVYA
jgi:hypothetical protein